MSKGGLNLIPSLIAPDTQDALPPQVLAQIGQIDHYLVENVRSARRFISSLKIRPVADLSFEILDKETTTSQLNQLMNPLLEGFDMGIISEAGCPAIADPGNIAVSWAHRNQISVTPLVGPSSIMLALMASGFNGQHFEFHGYLPIDAARRKRQLKQLEAESQRTGKTQIFMETPYRNLALYKAILTDCLPGTNLCLASSLTAPDQKIVTQSVGSWRGQEPPDIHKIPCIFLLHAGQEI
jgi:16S rRNA (cytidine1402-2'-O)-methyltransferase